MTLRARHPRLVYASITGYGSSGPWTQRRAYAPVVGAEAGITKAQGDARGSAYTNDPFSHADVYTALEAAAAILAALYRRERTGEGCWIDVSMAQTMLYVNEHLHDQLYDGDVDSGLDPQLRPRRLPRRQHRERRPRDDQRPPGRARHVRAVRRRLRARRAGLVGALRHRRGVAGEPRRAAASTSPVPRRRSPTPPRWRSGWASTASLPARCARRASWPSRRGRGSAGDRRRLPTAVAERSASPTRRGASTTFPARSPASRATAARTIAPCSPSCSGYDDDGDRRAGGGGRPVEPPAAPLSRD